MNKILLVGLVCLSLGAFAQSNADQGQTSNTKTSTSRDAASGQASGRSLQQSNVIHRDLAARNQAAGKTTSGTSNGNKSATDDWSTSTAKASGSSNGSNGGVRVATGDVNGDGHADLTNAKSSGHATEKDAVMNSGTTVQGPRDAATGQASGKRQHQPLTIRKEVDAASPKLITKDTDSATPKTVTIQKENDAASPK